VTGFASNPGRRRREHGSAVLEVLVLVPVIFALIDIAVYAGQMRMAHSTVRAAAQEAARFASVERTTGQAHFWSYGTGGLISTSQNLSCGTPSTGPGGVAWTNPTDPYVTTPVGQPATITVRVTCQIPINLIGVPGTARLVTITETASTVLDTYRARR
jgi:Flp pilus assembly protein TadG